MAGGFGLISRLPNDPTLQHLEFTWADPLSKQNFILYLLIMSHKMMHCLHYLIIKMMPNYSSLPLINQEIVDGFKLEY